ncbi:MAG: prepilin-type N-terminal cleavage/methylation domain-containing protein [Planctomycetes bacterium]|nr:prepilin-type N-terminal cleavage/methylation domain-containing protein [Planctomycetota bacterium]
MRQTETRGTRCGAPPHRGRDAGFTLVEVLLAITLTAMICAVLYGVVHGTLTTQARLAGYNDAALLADRIVDMIAADLATVYVAEFDGEKPFVAEDNTELSLPADCLTLISATPARLPTLDHDPVGVSGFREITYTAVASRTREGYLSLYRREAILDRKASEGGRFALLHDQVEAFDLKFLGRDDTEIAWDKGREHWEYTPEDGLPRLVLIMLTVSLGTPAAQDEEEPGARRVDRFRRQEVYRIVALPPGMSEDSSKLAALEPKDPRAPQAAGGPATPGATPPGSGTTPALNPLLGGFPVGAVPPPGSVPANNPLLKLLERHQLGR